MVVFANSFLHRGVSSLAAFSREGGGGGGGGGAGGGVGGILEERARWFGLLMLCQNFLSCCKI